jgi:hypothetical protein
MFVTESIRCACGSPAHMLCGKSSTMLISLFQIPAPYLAFQTSGIACKKVKYMLLFLTNRRVFLNLSKEESSLPEALRFIQAIYSSQLLCGNQN